MSTKISEYKYERADIECAIEYAKNAAVQVKSATSGSEIVSIRAQLNEYFKTFFTAVSLATIRNTLDTRDEYYAAEHDYYDENLPKLSSELTRFNRAIVESPYAAELDRSTR